MHSDLIFRALERSGESSFIANNHVEILRDGPVVFSSWLEDIAKAQKTILFSGLHKTGPGSGFMVLRHFLIVEKKYFREFHMENQTPKDLNQGKL